MKLLSIAIENFRSIEETIFELEEIDGSHTFTLIGINESGKSSFLRAISLMNAGETVSFPKDYFDHKKPITVTIAYKLNSTEENELTTLLRDEGFGDEILSQIKIEKLNVSATFNPVVGAVPKYFDQLTFEKELFDRYTLFESNPKPKNDLGSDGEVDFDVRQYFEVYHPQYFYQKSHHITFWKSDSKHLISEPIDLNQFAISPDGISIPLKNCFALAGIDASDIAAEIETLNANLAMVNNLQSKLGDKVTAHIRKVWPTHPVTVRFQISGSMLSFLVEDMSVSYDAKTLEQRSDGFKQFISFLLTVSAESANSRLSNSLLLLDEPETHLHPQAQEYLKDELIKITKNSENNVVIFATHSNYMIDKDHIDRSFRVVKQENRRTELKRIEGSASSFSEVNFEVFDILTNDYHNELYGYLMENEQTRLELNNLEKTKKWHNKKTARNEKVSLPTYIRHSIHHPENTSNTRFTRDELTRSIEVLRDLKKHI
jgi:predicted ATPase